MQALRVAAAPRELEQAGARRTGDAEGAGEALLVEVVQAAHRRGRTERPLRARVVEASHGLESDRRARDSRRYLEPQSEGREEPGTVEVFPLTDRERRRQHRAGRVRSGERLTLERADQDAVGKGCP